jgi:hypothetical protein
MAHLRSRVFVDRQVQGALTRRVVLHWLAFGVCLTIVLAAMQSFQYPLASLDEHLALFPRRYGLMYLVLAMLMPAFMWDTVRLSHRFAGPVLRLRRMMKELSAGEDPGELRFRDGDFWLELGDHFNGIRARLYPESESQESSSTNSVYELTAKDAD